MENLDPELRFRFLRLKRTLPLCDQIREVDRCLAERGTLFKDPEHREHLHECKRCRVDFPAVTAAYEAFDDISMKALRQLLRAVQLSLDSTEERASRITSLTLEDYRDSASGVFNPEDAEDLANEGFQSDLSQAQDVIAWRAVVVAKSVGEIMSQYAATWTATVWPSPWLEWRAKRSDEAVVSFVQGLNPDEVLAALLAFQVHRTFARQIKTLAIPSDGDLSEIGGHLVIQRCHTWPEWLDALGDPPADLDCTNFLQLVLSECLHELEPRNQSDSVADSVSGMVQRLRDLEDKIESNSALQIPILDQLGELSRHLDARNPFTAEESLKAALGPDTFSSLCPEARTAAVHAEYLYQDPRVPDPSEAVGALAKAFEVQLKEAFLRPLCCFIREKGIRAFPTYPNSSTAQRRVLLISNGRALLKQPLGVMLVALKTMDAELDSFCRTNRFDLRRILEAIQTVQRERPSSRHESRMSFEYARQVRDAWISDGGIFKALLPMESLSPRA